MHIALARKYRPQNFLEVIGQDAVIKTIQTAIETGRIHHAYLFTGVRGVGKTSMARILAKSINCLTSGPTLTPCQTCASCVGITQSNSLDVIEIDGASNNLVDDVRELREQVKYLPTDGKYKIIIIDEVHMLSNSAFNALLKTLEEPPAHVMFIFATTESHKIPVTILSRCQKYDFRKLNTPTLLGHLRSIANQENISIDDAALNLIARCAQGSVRDGLSLLDQVITTKQGDIGEADIRHVLGLGDRLLIQDAFAKLVTEDLVPSLDMLDQIDNLGLDLKLFTEDLLLHYRNLILLVSTKKYPTDIGTTEQEFYKPLAQSLDLSLLLAQYQILFQSIQDLTYSDAQKTVLEITFVKLSQVRQMIGLTDLVDSIKNKRPPTQTTSMRPAPNTNKIQTAASTQTSAATPQKPAVPAPASSSTAPIDWYDLVKWITQEKPPIGSLLKDAKPVQFSDKHIEIAMPAQSPTRSMLIERVSTIEAMIETRFGKKVPFQVSDVGDQKKKPSA